MSNKETHVETKILLDLGSQGVWLHKNHIGTGQVKSGAWVKFGFCNPGGSDLVGGTPIIITQEMVGKKMLIFTAIEVKQGKGKARDNQKSFINAVKSMGGIAGIAKSTEQALNIINNFIRGDK